MSLTWPHFGALFEQWTGKKLTRRHVEQNNQGIKKSLSSKRRHLRLFLLVATCCFNSAAAKHRVEHFRGEEKKNIHRILLQPGGRQVGDDDVDAKKKRKKWQALNSVEQRGRWPDSVSNRFTPSLSAAFYG